MFKQRSVVLGAASEDGFGSREYGERRQDQLLKSRVAVGVGRYVRDIVKEK